MTQRLPQKELFLTPNSEAWRPGEGSALYVRGTRVGGDARYFRDHGDGWHRRRRETREADLPSFTVVIYLVIGPENAASIRVGRGI
jgi:hypothetical protein